MLSSLPRRPGGKRPFAGDPGSAGRFIKQYFAVQRRAAAGRSSRVVFRQPALEVHGPYCQVFRDVLNLVPGDVASACFKLGDAQQLLHCTARAGSIGEGVFAIDDDNVQALRKVISAEPARCQGCFNHFHCAGACPMTAPLKLIKRAQLLRCPNSLCGADGHLPGDDRARGGDACNTG